MKLTSKYAYDYRPETIGIYAVIDLSKLGADSY